MTPRQLAVLEALDGLLVATKDLLEAINSSDEKDAKRTARYAVEVAEEALQMSARAEKGKKPQPGEPEHNWLWNRYGQPVAMSEGADE
jgi:hypothetical protein